MKIVEQEWGWVLKPSYALERIEEAGRTCYKSEDDITEGSAEKFVRMIIKKGHESVIEHVNASVRFITNRGVTHELVRHRLCAFSQESTRYVNYSGKMEFIRPVWMTSIFSGDWQNGLNDGITERLGRPNEDEIADSVSFIYACLTAEENYNDLIKKGWKPQQAREVLPNALKTEIVVTANLREWRHIFKLRTSKAAHPQMRALMIDCLDGFKKIVPVLFNDINPA